MNSVLRVVLQTTPEQSARLGALQATFAEVCNALAPLVQQTACWNRVALHHMAYRQLRTQFPTLGSQMVCNAIYSVSRACRVIYQNTNSPFNIQRLHGKPLPRLHFLPQAPVYFDRHTLSLKDGQVSMFTMDGRMRFQLNLRDEDERRFRTDKLREIVLTSKASVLTLSFGFAPSSEVEEDAGTTTSADDLPDHVVVVEDEQMPLPHALQIAQFQSPQP
jgi:hypothetical protein